MPGLGLLLPLLSSPHYFLSVFQVTSGSLSEEESDYRKLNVKPYLKTQIKIIWPIHMEEQEKKKGTFGSKNNNQFIE